MSSLGTRIMRVGGNEHCRPIGADKRRSTRIEGELPCASKIGVNMPAAKPGIRPRRAPRCRIQRGRPGLAQSWQSPLTRPRPSRPVR
jgi:hypothetical protein